VQGVALEGDGDEGSACRRGGEAHRRHGTHGDEEVRVVDLQPIVGERETGRVEAHEMVAVGVVCFQRFRAHAKPQRGAHPCRQL